MSGGARASFSGAEPCPCVAHADMPFSLPSDHKYQAACEAYTKALEIAPSAILYANRAFSALPFLWPAGLFRALSLLSLTACLLLSTHQTRELWFGTGRRYESPGARSHLCEGTRGTHHQDSPQHDFTATLLKSREYAGLLPTRNRLFGTTQVQREPFRFQGGSRISLPLRLAILARMEALSCRLLTAPCQVQAVKIAPKDRDCRAKYKECEKAYKEARWSEAIAVDLSSASPFNSIGDIDAIGMNS